MEDRDRDNTETDIGPDKVLNKTDKETEREIGRYKY